MPDESPKRLIVVGDRVLIAPEEGEERTNVGLYLPPTAVESRQVQGGRVVATGPGTPMTEPASMDDEPWKIRGPDVSTCRCRRGLGITRCSSARLPWRSRSKERSTWSSRRRQSSCWCGNRYPRNWSRSWPTSDGPGAALNAPKRKAYGEARGTASSKSPASP